MKLLRSWLCYLLLFAFGVILTPRVFWHDHHSEDNHHISHEGDHSGDFEEDCYLCDFTLQPALVPIAFKFDFTKVVNGCTPKATISFTKIRVLAGDVLRGPPANI